MSTWQALNNQPNFNTGSMVLLTDGRIMVHEESTAHWHALTPDDQGSYINGTWSNLKDMAFWRRYFVTAVLKDGRVFLIGGEQTGDVGDTNKGEIYNPVNDTWTPIALPPWSQVGDASACVFPDGRIMIGALLSGDCIIYDSVHDNWVTAATHSGRTNEETWILQPDNTILTIQCFSPYGGQKYNIDNNTWQTEGTAPDTLVDHVMSEVGPGMLTYNGKTIFFGAANVSGHGKTLLYKPPSTPTASGTWTQGPDIPQLNGQTLVCNDCPATLLPNGKVLFTAAQFVNNGWGSPIYFFEYDPVSNSISQANTPSNNATFPYPSFPGIYWSRMMLLPNGQVLFSASSNNVQCYSPSGTPDNAWRPTISAITTTPLPINHYVLQGTQLNGLSQANIYGDDCYPATNYPLVRLENPVTHQVYYARTYNFSTLGVATGASLQSCQFEPPAISYGVYNLSVIANGISSFAHSFDYKPKSKPWIFDNGVKIIFERFGKEVVEGDPWNRLEWGIDPEITALKSEVRSLQNSVKRLSSLIKNQDLPRISNQIDKNRNSLQEVDNHKS